jgi:polysaccharide pyruvyl transferase WcaK-like protein
LEETEAISSQLAEDAARRTRGNVVVIENHLVRSGKGPDEIEQQYAQCALVITSRFHGAIAALRHNTPYIAIDQITGGAKVAPLLEALPWPHVHRIEEVDRERIRQDVAPILEGRDNHLLHSTRVAAVSAANSTLRRLDDWVSTLV